MAEGEPWHLKYRPRQFGELVGQDVNATILRRMVAEGKVVHGICLAGPRGTGKTSTARIISAAYNCTAPTSDGEPCTKCEQCIEIRRGVSVDVQELDAASHGLVDDIRKLVEDAQYVASDAEYRIYVLDEAHSMSRQAFDAMLKVLEEPPRKTIFILCTTQFDRLPDTITSRCMVMEYRALSLTALVGRLGQIAAWEGVQAGEDALTMIARAARGGMRDAIMSLEQAALYGQNNITKDVAAQVVGDVPFSVFHKLFTAQVEGSMFHVLELLRGLFQKQGDISTILRGYLEFLRDYVLVHGGAASLTTLTRQEAKALREIVVERERIFHCTDIIVEALAEARRRITYARLHAELALLQCILVLAGEGRQVGNGARTEQSEAARIAQLFGGRVL